MSPDLDLACARAAATVPRLEPMMNLSTAAAAVLAQNGPYALFIYLRDQKKANRKEAAERIQQAAFRLLSEEVGLAAASTTDGMQASVMALCADLEKMLLAKALLAQMLMYLRYHARAGA